MAKLSTEERYMALPGQKKLLTLKKQATIDRQRLPEVYREILIQRGRFPAKMFLAGMLYQREIIERFLQGEEGILDCEKEK